MLFRLLDLLIKFNPKGEVIFKKVLDRPGLNPVMRAIWDPGGAVSAPIMGAVTS